MPYKKVAVLNKFMRFDEVGSYVEGYLDRIEQVDLFGRKAERGVLISDDGSEIYLPSNWELNEFFKRVLSNGCRGCKVKIVYIGERRIKGGRRVKSYEFYIDEDDRLNQEDREF